MSNPVLQSNMLILGKFQDKNKNDREDIRTVYEEGNVGGTGDTQIRKMMTRYNKNEVINSKGTRGRWKTLGETRITEENGNVGPKD